MNPTCYVDRDKEILMLAKGRRVLHLGCVGHTDLSPEERVHLAQRSLHWKLTAIADVTGVDCSLGVIEEYKKHNIFTNIVYGDVQALKDVKVNGVFDVIIAADIIEHLSNPGEMLEGMKRFCDDDTQIVITTPHAFGLPNYIRFLMGKYHDGHEHVMTFNSDNIRVLLMRHGFKLKRLSSCFQSHAKSKQFLFPIGKTLLKKFPRLGGTLLTLSQYTHEDLK